MTTIVRRAVSAVREGRVRSAIARRVEDRRKRRAYHEVAAAFATGTTHFIHGDPNSDLARILQQSFFKAMLGESKLAPEILAIEGMSGQRYRSTINQVIAAVPDARYLEIGSWAGSTAASALYGNAATCVCIDNWSQFGGPRRQFFDNVAKATSDRVSFRFIEDDFRSVDYAGLGPFNVYLFDGPHGINDHYDGVIAPQICLEHQHIFIVDDWNWADVRVGTMAALHDIKSEVEFAIEVRTSHDNSQPALAYEKSDWHNGYFMAVVRRRL